jgi:hypothetical protein
MYTGSGMIFVGLLWSAVTLLFDGFVLGEPVRRALTLWKPTAEGLGHGGLLDLAEAVSASFMNGSDLFFLMFMTPFNAVMFGFWVAGWAQLRQRWFKPAAGGVRIVSRLRKTTVRLTSFTPVATAIATMTLIAFFGIFAICIFGGAFNPSLRTMQVTWGIILAGGVTAWAWQWWQILAGRYDLILDERQGRLVLPLTHGRKRREPIPFARVQSVYVEIIEKTNSDGGGTHVQYVPTMRVGDGDGTAERLVEWSNEVRANAFVEWLKAKLPPRKPRAVGEARMNC